MSKNPTLQLVGGSTPTDKANRNSIHKWLIMVLMNKVFSGQSDNMLTNMRDVLQKNANTSTFPVQELNQRIATMGRTAGFIEENLLRELLDIEYGDREDFLALSLLYDDKSWSTVSFQKDHIFPQSAFSAQHLRSVGYNDDKISDLQALQNRLGNLQLILDIENAGKKDKPIDEWLATRNENFRSTHLIPEDSNLLKIERFEDFLKAREDLIRIRLASIFTDGTEE